jgi:hypothetical protein
MVQHSLHDGAVQSLQLLVLLAIQVQGDGSLFAAHLVLWTDLHVHRHVLHVLVWQYSQVGTIFCEC